MLVLSRTVNCGGLEFPEGTPIEELPLENRDSVVGSGWARPGSAVIPRLEDKPIELPAEDQASPAANSDPEQPFAPNETPAEQASDADEVGAEDDAEDAAEDSPSLLELAISDELKELLATGKLADGSAVETIADVMQFGSENNGWRVIKGIGKVGNQEITDAVAKYGTEK